MKKHCDVCGKEYSTEHKTQMFCSRECVKIARTGKPHPGKKELSCVVCGKPIERHQMPSGSWSKRKTCSAECLSKLTKNKDIVICRYCGKEYHPKMKDRNKYCSRECAFADRKANKKRTTCIICGKEIEGHQKYCSDDCRTKATYIRNKKTFVERECRICGRSYFGRKNGVAACSEECKAKWKANYGKVRQKYLKQKAERDRNKRPGKCEACGELFIPKMLHQRYCSGSCQRRDRYRRKEIKRRLRLIENGEVDFSITLGQVIERYKGLCAICGESVNVAAKFTDNDYPSIDHIIPVARGGTHTWDNVQLAHRGCNIAKQDRIPECVSA